MKDDYYTNGDWQRERPAPWVVCAAIRKGERIICGARHYDTIMRNQITASEGQDHWRGCEQGFINQYGEFLTRAEARVIANTNSQQSKEKPPHDEEILYSEDLY